MTTARRTLDTAMTEAQLMDAIVDYAERLGYLIFHAEDRAPDPSRGDYRRWERGFPDLILVRAGEPVLAVELKSQGGKVRHEQQCWLSALGEARWIETYVWRPSSWSDGTIIRRLR